MRIISFIFCLLLFQQAGATTTVYKWEDEQGRIHYGERPDDSNAQSVEIKHKNPKNPYLEEREAQRQQRAKASRIERSQTHADEKAKQEARDAQAQRQKVCAQYQGNLKLLNQSGRRVYTVSPDGEYHYFSDEQRQQEITKIQQDLERHCKESDQPK